MLSPASCPRARASCLYASIDLGWHRTRCWLYGHPWPGTVGNDMDREPGTGGGKPGTRDGASGTTGYGKPSTSGTASLAPVMVRLAPPGMYGKPGTGDGKPGTGDGESEPGTRDQGAPGTTDGRTRDGTSAGNNMYREPGTRDGAVQCTCVHARLLRNKFTLVGLVICQLVGSQNYAGIKFAPPFARVYTRVARRVVFACRK